MQKFENLSPCKGLALASLAENKAVFSTDVGKLEVTVYAEGCFRVRLGDAEVNDYGIVCAKDERLALNVLESQDDVLCSSGEYALRLTRSPLTYSLEKNGKVVLPVTEDSHFVRKFRLPPVAATEEGWFAALGLPFGVAVYGGGENYAGLNRRGMLLDMWNEDALGVNSSVCYKNCPFVWSPEGYGVFVNTPAYVRIGVGYQQWANQSLCLDVKDAVLDLFFLFGDTPAEILRRYTHLTGRSAKAPVWSLGLWLSKAYYRVPAETLEAASKMREMDVPCDVITIDGRAWQDTDTRFAFEWDPTRYDDPKAFCDSLKAMNYKICVWEYPLVSIKNKLFGEMAEKGWLLRDKDGKAYEYAFDPGPFGQVLTQLPNSGLVDFTNPEAWEYWCGRHKELFDAGVDCIKADFGEQVLPDMYACNGDDGIRIHNVYSLLYNLCVYEAGRRYYGENALCWSRSGWAGSQRAPIQWAGDSQSSWGGLAGSILGGLSWGMSGVPYYSSDIGGFYGDQPTPELFVRWTEAGALGSHMRFHGIGPREPWAYGAEAEDICRRWVRLRYRLIPYLSDASAQAAATGMPLMRSMVLSFPDEPEVWPFELQYMLGDSLLVVPVVREGGKVRYRLPKGTWYDFWTGKAVAGDRTVEETVALDRIPVFVREGAVLKLGPVVSHTGEIENGKRIAAVTVFGEAAENSCTYDDEVAFENGKLVPAAHVSVVEPEKLHEYIFSGGNIC